MSVPVALPEPIPLTTHQRLTGRLAVTGAYLLLAATRGRPARLGRALRVVQRGARPATPAEAGHARAVVETVSLRCASHLGCLPRSVAIVLLCRLHRRTVTWRVGVHSPPPTSHAWVEADRHPVGEPCDPHLLYTTILTV